MTMLATEVETLLKKNAANEIMVDALLQWASNPTSASAGYGLEENYPYIVNNLKLRYPLLSAEVDAAVHELRMTCNRLIKIEPKGQVNEIRRLILQEIERGESCRVLRQGVLNRLAVVSEDTRRFLLLGHLLSNEKSYLVSLDNLRTAPTPGLDIQGNIQAYLKALFNQTAPAIAVIQEAIRSGTHNDLYWVPSPRATSSPGPRLVPAIIPTVQELDAMGTEAPKMPDLNAEFSAWLQDEDFTLLRLVDMASHAPSYVADVKELLPATVDRPGLLGRHGQLLAVSPVIADAMRLGIDETKFQLVDRSRLTVEAALRLTQRNAGSDWAVQVLSSRPSGETLWALQHLTSSPLFIYFAPWLTGQTQDLLPRLNRRVHLLLVVPYQTPHSTLSAVDDLRISQSVDL